MWRIWAVFSFIAAVFFLIVLRLAYWQIIRGDALRLEASRQHFITFSVPSERGSVYTSDGFPLVINQPASLVYAQPKEIKDILGTSEKLAPLLGTEAASISAILSLPDRVWVPVKHKVEGDTVDKIKALNLPGIGFTSEPKRYYPEASMSAQMLGFVGLDQNGADKGYFGLEGYYDRELRGKDGYWSVEKDVRGAPILVGDVTRIEPEDGRTLVLWLDRTIQATVENHLKEGLEKYGAKAGTVTVMDPKTGGILAMASYPSYDPGKYTEFDRELYKNPIVASGYEPGSTFKTIVMGAGLDARVIKSDTAIEETGPVKVSGYDIRTWNDKYNGHVTMTDVLIHSSNVGMVFVQRQLGREKMIKLIHDFGFGVPTNVDLEDETSPDIRPDDDWKEIDLATASFGQGIAVTPLQMIRSVAALANGGVLMEPHIVREIRGTDGKTSVIPPRRVSQVISKTASAVITEMMVDAVDKGEAKFAKPKGYRIAGKTGTAQIPVSGHYDASKTIASFVGFAPADDPKFVMLVTLTEPTSSPWGSETAAPLFFNIAKDLFLYYGIGAQ